jgi:hypothetical protein|tara:strand:+ start:1233 stop:1730 length:498 start_codon:yes stop_codon:yes gene_type:complete
MPDEKRRKVDIGEFDAKDREVIRWVAQVLGYDIQIFGQRIRQQIEGLASAGVSKQSIARLLDSDLKSNGRIFGEYANSIKRGVVGGIMQISRRELHVGDDVRYRWVVAQGVKNCPDCLARAGEVDTWSGWISRGMPATGWSVCKQNCYCQVVPVDTDIDDIVKVK